MVPCVLILTIALGTAFVVYETGTNVRFGAPCTIQAFIHLSQENPRTPDDQKFINNLAAQAVTTAVGAGVYSDVARALKIDATGLAANTRTTPAPGLGVFYIVVFDPDAARAITLANAVCEQFVSTIKKQRAAEVSSQLARIQERIATIQKEVRRLQAISRPTPTDRANLQAQRAALIRNQVLIAGIISLPPDDVSVLTRARSTVRKESRSLRQSLVIAAIAGILACFIYILALEAFLERKRRMAAGASSS